MRMSSTKYMKNKRKLTIERKGKFNKNWEGERKAWKSTKGSVIKLHAEQKLKRTNTKTVQSMVTHSK